MFVDKIFNFNAFANISSLRENSLYPDGRVQKNGKVTSVLSDKSCESAFRRNIAQKA